MDIGNLLNFENENKTDKKTKKITNSSDVERVNQV